MSCIRIVWFSCLLLLIAGTASAQKHITLSGYTRDKLNSEALPGVYIQLKELQRGIETNKEGFFTLSIPAGIYTIEAKLPGYDFFSRTMPMSVDTLLNITMELNANLLNEVTISSEHPNINIRRSEMSVEKLNIQQIKIIPALFGEVDIIKAIQLLPGVQSTSEGSSGFSVRGGSPDQNLILFEDATVYNASHLMGFFSIFNNDAVQNVTLYKGDIPTIYGGRLSSLLDVSSRSGNNEFGGAAGIGLIASRLMLEGPIVKNNASFLIAARRTYADIFLGLSSNEDLYDVSLFFYDLNAQIQGKINAKNYLSFTGYLGRDKYGGNDTGMDFGNKTFSLRWKHLFSEKLFMHLEPIGSHYNYKMTANSPSIKGEWESGIVEYGLRDDFTYIPDKLSTFKFGYNSTFQQFRPGNAVGTIEGKSTPYRIDIAKQKAWENALYFHHQHTFFHKWTIKYGLRYTRFDNIGPTTNYIIDNNYTLIDSVTIRKGDFYNTYHGLEPRAGMVYVFNEAISVKASYSRTIQFLHLLSMSTSGSPLDVWVPSNPTIKPQSSQQFAAGVFNNFFDNLLETSLEIYYKKLDNVIDFKDHPQVLGNDIIETEIRMGKGESYGIEFMLRKNTGKLAGWFSYTYSRSFRTIPAINKGEAYSAPYDRPHNINIVLSYTFNRRLTASLNWVYATGQPVTFPEARYQFGDDFIPVFTARNTYRMPDYHRMDASVNIQLGDLQKKSKWKHELNISVYNLYWRKNPWTINYRTENLYINDMEVSSQYAQMTYLFGIVPSITYNISFNQ